MTDEEIDGSIVKAAVKLRKLLSPDLPLAVDHHPTICNAICELLELVDPEKEEKCDSSF